MILPLTHERNTVRSLPWVSLTVIALCVAAFLMTTARYDGAGSGGLETALEYWAEHPYLTLDPRLVPPTGHAFLREIVPDRQPVGRGTQGIQQRELDRLTREWLEATRNDPVWRYGLIPSEIRAPSVLTHMFMHADWIHLLGNLFLFFLLAPFVEDLWGSRWFAAFFLLAGIFSGLMFTTHYSDLYRPLVGASGAVAAAMGAFLVLHGRAKIKFFYWVGFFAGTFQAPAWLMLPLWFGGELFSAVITDKMAPGGMLGGVAYWAHVWGFAFGLAGAGVARWLKIGEDDALDLPVHEEALLFERQGFPDEAWRILSEETARNPANTEAAATQWEMALRLGYAPSVAQLGHRLVRAKIQEGQTETALTWWRGLRQATEIEDTAVSARLSQEALRMGRPDEARTLLQETIASLRPDAPLALLVKLVRFARDVDKNLHQDLVEKALAHPGLSDDLRLEMEDQHWRIG